MNYEFSNEFLDKWLLAKEEKEKRVKLVKYEIEKIENLSPLFKDFFLDPEIVRFIEIVKFLAKLKPVTDDMLLDFIAGVANLRLAKTEKHYLNIIQLMEPASKKLMEFYDTEDYLNSLVNREIAENGKIEIGNVTFQITKEAIKLFIRKKRIRPRIIEDITKAETAYVNSKNEQYGRTLNNDFKGKNSEVKIEKKPTFKPEIIDLLFHEIKDFFDNSQQPELLRILTDGTDTKDKLTFRDNGNRLADSFKQLYDGDLVVGCTKQILEEWIHNNFNYVYRNVVKSYTLKYLNDIISSHKLVVKRPIFNVIKGEIKKL